MIRILLADCHELSRLAMRTMLDTEADMELIGEACTSEELFCKSENLIPDLIVLELALIGCEFASTLSELVQSGRLVLILTANLEQKIHLQALRSGAVGIVTKNQSLDLILKAIRKVCAGETWLDRFVTHELLRNYWQPQAVPPQVEISPAKLNQGLAGLSKRENEIARLAAQGLSSKLIANHLCISDKTVRNALTIIYDKLGVANQIGLVMKAADLGVN